MRRTSWRATTCAMHAADVPSRDSRAIAPLSCPHGLGRASGRVPRALGRVPFTKVSCNIEFMSSRVIPRIAPYHRGPYKLAAILQDPGTLHGSGCNAQITGEVGVLNGDPTANLCREALEAHGLPLSSYLPLNAVPWYDAPRHRNDTLLREGAHFNRALILESGVKLVLLLGKQACRSERWLDLPNDVETRRLPHPGRLGLINYHVDGGRVGTDKARRVLIEGFAPVAQE